MDSKKNYLIPMLFYGEIFIIDAIKGNWSFQGHNAVINCVTFLMDSRRIISADRDGLLCVWLAESATLLQTIQGPYKSLAATNNMKFAVSTMKLSYCRINRNDNEMKN